MVLLLADICWLLLLTDFHGLTLVYLDYLSAYRTPSIYFKIYL